MSFEWANKPSRDFLVDYFKEGETVESRVRDIADRAQSILGITGFSDKFYDYMSRGYFSLSSPVWSNFGRERGCPISCFGQYIADSCEDIMDSVSEASMMTKLGGGTSGYFGAIRPEGSEISAGGESDGPASFCRLFDTVSDVWKQSQVRRGSFAAYLPIEHPDVSKFINMRHPGDLIQKVFPAVTITDDWMQSMIDGDKGKRELWASVLKSRTETGTPYIMFSDNVNNKLPEWYVDNQLDVSASNLCVAPETLILTDAGYQVISTLENHEVSVWNGEEWSGVTVRKTGTDVKLSRVTFSDGSSIDCTPEHKFYIQNEYGKKSTETRTNELVVGDKLEKFKLPSDVDLDYPDLKHAYDLGFYAGDGNEGYDFSWVYGEKADVVPRLTLGRVSDKFSKYGRKKWHHGPIEVKYAVPLSSNVSSRLDWLAGLLDADGCVLASDNCDNIQICSVQYQFLHDIKLMLQEMGVSSTLTFRRAAGQYELPKNDGSGENGLYDCNEIWLLCINGYGVKRLVELGIKFSRLQLKEQNPQRDASRFVTVVSVEDTGRVSDTYCATEPKRGKLIFNGVLTGNCSEILLSSDENHSFVCCLSSINVKHWDEIKNTDAIEVLVYFLDAVLTEFIDKASEIPFMEKSVNFAKRERAIGVGILGWHTYLQDNMIPFETLQAEAKNLEIIRGLAEQSHAASEKMAKEFGEPPLLEGRGRRHSFTNALAPTTSSSWILGQVSQSIELFRSNYYVKNLAKGRFSFRNPKLQEVLEEKGKNTPEVWQSILEHDGSVQHLTNVLDEHEREVFKTFKETSQMSVIKQAAVRQQFLDQGQSLNILIDPETPVKDINKLHIEAWKLGISCLYYQHSINASQEAIRNMLSCSTCEG